MEKNTVRTAFHRGFTLIELMIVIVILGILMGTILPRLTGGQARARDLGRKADLNNIAQALELYYQDFGQYPGTSGTVTCLDSAASFYDNFKSYFKGEILPSPPQTGEQATLGAVTCADAYIYAPLRNNNVANNGYLLGASVEIPQSGNYGNGLNDDTGPTSSFAFGATTTVSDVLNALIDDAGSMLGIERNNPDSGDQIIFLLAN